MAPSRSALILGIISVLLLVTLTGVLWHFTSGAYPDTQSERNLIASLISGLNCSILFGWLAFGVLAGTSLAILASFLVLFLDLRSGLRGYSIFAAPFFITAVIGYISTRMRGGLVQRHTLRSEKLEEEMNLLSNNIDEKRKNICALEEKMKRYSILKEVAESLGTVLELDDIADLIIEKTSKTIGKKGRILLYLVDAERQAISLSRARGDSRVESKKGDIFDGWVFKHRKSLIVEDVGKDFRFPADGVDEAKKTVRSLIAAPLASEHKLLGILRMDSPEENAYAQDDLRLLDIIADLGALAIQNALLYSKTQELAIHDSLTRLYVRRYFITRLHEEMKRAGRTKKVFSLLILDIDHFKSYNDKYGHAAGDLILKYLAKTVISNVREGDIVGRYGGEEILILLSGVDVDGARQEAEKIRRSIKERPFSLRRKEVHVTASMGIASYPKDAVLDEELIRIADERLYRAKQGGRDRVCSD